MNGTVSGTMSGTMGGTMDAPVTVLYIAGFGRNGGTLLDRVLGSIDGFFSLGEFRFVWQKGVLQNELCNCGAPFHDCPFWKDVFSRAFGGMTQSQAMDMVRLFRRVDRTRYMPVLMSAWKPPRFQSRLTACAETIDHLFSTIRDVSGARVLVDSSKFAGYGVVLSQAPNLRVHVVHLVRDSRGTAHSWLKRRVKPEVSGPDAWLRRYSVLSSTTQWSYRNLSSEYLSKVGESYLRIRYEDFAREPRRHLERILSQIGEHEAELPISGERTAHLAPSHTQSGNPMRFHRGSLDIRIDSAWREQLPTHRRATVTMLTWPLLRRYGYH